MIVKNKTYYIITDTDPLQYGVWNEGIEVNTLHTIEDYDNQTLWETALLSYGISQEDIDETLNNNLK
jgi:hypothetical protein